MYKLSTKTKILLIILIIIVIGTAIGLSIYFILIKDSDSSPKPNPSRTEFNDPSRTKFNDPSRTEFNDPSRTEFNDNKQMLNNADKLPNTTEPIFTEPSTMPNPPFNIIGHWSSVNSDSKGKTPNITSLEFINNIDITTYFPFVCSMGKNLHLPTNTYVNQNCYGYEIYFYKMGERWNFYVTELDYNTNTVTLNGTSALKLTSEEAWPFTINITSNGTPPKLLNYPPKTTIENTIGDPPLNVDFYATIKSDSNGKNPDITSNVINNIDFSTIKLKIFSYIDDYGYQIQFTETSNNIRFNVTQIDFNTNSLTFNAPSSFKLNSSEAWPFDINTSKYVPPPKYLGFPPPKNNGDPLVAPFTYRTVSSDSNLKRPDITSNVINNISIKNMSYFNGISVYAYQIKFKKAIKESLNEYFFYVTHVDFNTNTITFNAPVSFKLNSVQAWPFDINFINNGPTSKYSGFPPTTTSSTPSTTMGNTIGDPPIEVDIFYTINSDANDERPDITSNVINNINLSNTQIQPQYMVKLVNHGFQIQFTETSNNIRFNVTQIDFNTNSLTFNAPVSFKLNSVEAWPFDINVSKNIPPPIYLGLSTTTMGFPKTTRI